MRRSKKHFLRWSAVLLTLMMAAVFLPAVVFATNDDVAEVHIEDYNDYSFYSDGEQVYEIEAYDENGELVDDWNPFITIGVRDDDGWVCKFRNTCYRYSDGTLTLIGSQILQEMKANSIDLEEFFSIHVSATEDGGPDCMTSNMLEMPRTEFDLSDTTVVMGSYKWIGSDIEYEVYNSQNPEGALYSYPITAVTSSDSSIVKVAKDESDWELIPLKKGKATITVSYKVGKTTKKHTFTATVALASLDVSLDDSQSKVLPGQSIELKAKCDFESMDEEIEPEISYEWTLEGESNYAEIKADPSDPSKAELTAKTLPEDIDSADVDVHVVASCTDKDGDVLTSEDNREIQITKEYYELDAEDIDLFVGESKEITPQVLHYTAKNPAGTPVEAEFSWTYEDGGKADISISNSNGSYTLERLTGEYVSLTLLAEYAVDGNDEEEPEIRTEEIYYSFNELSDDLEEYSIEFTNMEDEWDFYIDENTDPLTIEKPQIRVVAGDVEVPTDQYIVKVQKVLYDEEGEEYYEDVPESETLIGLDPEEEGYNGTARYRVLVTPTADSIFDQSSYLEGYLDFYSTNSLASGYTWLSWSNYVSRGEDAAGYYVFIAGQKTSPIVEAYDETRLKEGTDYSLKYININTGKEQNAFPTKIGSYYYVAEGLTPYYGEKTGDDFNVIPKATSISKLKKGKKSFTVKWKKQTAQTSGYQIQYSLKKNFSKAKTVKINKNKTTSKKIKKLKKKKTYYVRVRTFGKADGKTFYSDWSKVKKVKTK